jgi:hypothetical protein
LQDFIALVEGDHAQDLVWPIGHGINDRATSCAFVAVIAQFDNFSRTVVNFLG